MQSPTRKSLKSTATKGNVLKHDNYTEAFARIKAAINQGFFIEAIAIQEAIISDRLKSHLSFYMKLPKDEKFHSLLKAWKALDVRDNMQTVSTDLPELINQWRRQRNGAIHGFIAKDCNVDRVLKSAKVTAQIGLNLTRALCSWHGKQVRQSQKTRRAAKLM
jgi:hypothetical protein